MTSVTESPAWKALDAQQRDLAGRGLRSLFAEDPRRFDKYSLRLGDLLFDYSKHRITDVWVANCYSAPQSVEIIKFGDPGRGAATDTPMRAIIGQ